MLSLWTHDLPHQGPGAQVQAGGGEAGKLHQRHRQAAHGHTHIYNIYTVSSISSLDDKTG